MTKIAKSIQVEGSHPLVGTVVPSGARNSALKLLVASLFSSEDVVLKNVPRVEGLVNELELATALGVKITWLTGDSLLINASKLSSFELPYALARTTRTAALFAAPLIFRFGKAVIPKFIEGYRGSYSIDRWRQVWRSFNCEIAEDDENITLTTEAVMPANVNFKISTHMGTDTALLFSFFAPGESFITNAAEECEVNDLMDFARILGVSAQRVQPRTIKVSGASLFKGGTFEVQSDRNEIATMATAAIITNGNIVIKNVNKEALLSFVNLMTKLGVKYEFCGEDLRVWHKGNSLMNFTLSTAPAPGFSTDWQPLACLLGTYATGESRVHETIYTDRFGYTKELNMMGAKIDVVKPSSCGIVPVLSEEDYDFDSRGEPAILARIFGPTQLRGEKLNIFSARYGAALLLAALGAQGRSELHGAELLDQLFVGIVDKFVNLGANIS